MNAIAIAQMSIEEINTTLRDIKTRDPSFDPICEQVDTDSVHCEWELEWILPDIFKWFKLYQNDQVLDLVNYHIALQHRHKTNQLHCYDNDPSILPELLEDIQRELDIEDELSDADTDTED